MLVVHLISSFSFVIYAVVFSPSSLFLVPGSLGLCASAAVWSRVIVVVPKRASRGRSSPICRVSGRGFGTDDPFWIEILFYLGRRKRVDDFARGSRFDPVPGSWSEPGIYEATVNAL